MPERKRPTRRLPPSTTPAPWNHASSTPTLLSAAKATRQLARRTSGRCWRRCRARTRRCRSRAVPGRPRRRSERSPAACSVRVAREVGVAAGEDQRDRRIERRRGGGDGVATTGGAAPFGGVGAAGSGGRRGREAVAGGGRLGARRRCLRLLELGDALLERLQPSLVALAQLGELALHLLELARLGGARRRVRPRAEADRRPRRRPVLTGTWNAPDEMTRTTSARGARHGPERGLGSGQLGGRSTRVVRAGAARDRVDRRWRRRAGAGASRASH